MLAGELDTGQIIAALKDSGLRGMGGAGFPAGRKWDLVAAQEATPKYVICNADESEPGTFKDRQILAEQPHLVLEGMLLGMLAVGAEEGWVFIRHEYGPEEAGDPPRDRGAARRRAGRRRTRAAPAGGCRSRCSPRPGGYILGEESALIECMEGHRGEPRNKPPFPGIYGLWGKPTLMNSVETFAHVPVIASRGAAWWKQQGIGDHTGLKFFAVSGHVERPGVYCVPMGTTARRAARAGRRGRRRRGAGRDPAGRRVVELPRARPARRAAGLRHSGQGGLDARVGRAGGDGGGHRPARRGHERAAVLPRRVVRQVRALPGRLQQGAPAFSTGLLAAGGGPGDVNGQVAELATVMRRTSICGLGQVALGPVMSVPRLAGSGRGAERPRQRSPDGADVAGPAARSSSPPGRSPRRWPGSAPAAARPPRRCRSPRRCTGCRPPPVTAPHALPGFARSTVDGYAVRAADTYGVSEGLPGYLEVTGAVRMGAGAGGRGRPGGAVAACPPAACCPPGADAVVMIEYTAGGDARHDRGGPAGRPRRGRGPRRRGRRRRRRARAGRAAAARPGPRHAGRGRASPAVSVHARPRVTIFSTGDEVVPPRHRRRCGPGQVRDATAVGAGRAGGRGRRRARSAAASCPTTRAALEAALRAALPASDLIVISAGLLGRARGTRPPASSAGLGEPGSGATAWPSSPGKPTLLAECAGVPVIGLPGNPRSALVVFRLLGHAAGAPGRRLHRAAARARGPGPAGARPARPRPGGSTSSRSRCATAWPTPVFGLSALLSVSPRRRVYRVPEEAPGSTRARGRRDACMR